MAYDWERQILEVRLEEFKTAESAVVYIRAQLMDARSKSESRQDLDSKFTPIKYIPVRTYRT